MCGTEDVDLILFIMEAWFLLSVYQDVGGFKASSSIYLYKQHKVEIKAVFYDLCIWKSYHFSYFFSEIS